MAYYRVGRRRKERVAEVGAQMYRGPPRCHISIRALQFVAARTTEFQIPEVTSLAGNPGSARSLTGSLNPTSQNYHSGRGFGSDCYLWCNIYRNKFLREVENSGVEAVPNGTERREWVLAPEEYSLPARTQRRHNYWTHILLRARLEGRIPRSVKFISNVTRR